LLIFAPIWSAETKIRNILYSHAIKIVFMQEKDNIKPTIKQRILHFVDYLDISKRSFYEKTGISRGTLEGVAGITEDTLVKFTTNYPNINLVWLLTGDGDMLLSNTRAERENWIISNNDFSTARYSYKDLLRVGARIDEICYNYGVTHEQLAKAIGFDYHELTQIINGNKPAPVELLQKIGKFCPDLNPVWLYCGHGSMHTRNWYDDPVQEALDRDIAQHEQEIAQEALDREIENDLMRSRQEERLQEMITQYEKSSQHQPSQTKVEKPKKNI
jgi:transcriptional regulator with XRE-family HTH domain